MNIMLIQALETFEVSWQSSNQWRNQPRFSGAGLCAAAFFVLAFAIPAVPQDARFEAALANINKVADQGPFHAILGFAREIRSAGVVSGREVRHFHSLGRLLCSGVRQRVVSAQHVHCREPRFQTSRWRLTARSRSSATKISFPCFGPNNSTPTSGLNFSEKPGAKYVVPVAEHHDGFPMFDYDFTDWSAAKMGPKRDVVGELAAAVRKQGLHFGASSHRAEHWWFYNGGMTFDSDVRDPRYASFYGPAQSDKTQPDQAFLDDWLVRASQIVDKYHPEVVWFDWWIEQPVFPALPPEILPPSTTTAARNGSAASPSTTRTSRFRSAPPCSISSAGNWRPFARSSGRPTLR